MAKGSHGGQRKSGPPTDASVVTKADDTALPDGPATHLYIGGAGNVHVKMVGGTKVVLTGLAVGVWHEMSFVEVESTSTTATSIVAGYA